MGYGCLSNFSKNWEICLNFSQFSVTHPLPGNSLLRIFIHLKILIDIISQKSSVRSIHASWPFNTTINESQNLSSKDYGENACAPMNRCNFFHNYARKLLLFLTIQKKERKEKRNLSFLYMLASTSTKCCFRCIHQIPSDVLYYLHFSALLMYALVSHADLDNVWKVKPLLDGKAIMDVLHVKSGGRQVGEWVRQQKSFFFFLKQYLILKIVSILEIHLLSQDAENLMKENLKKG